MYKEAPIKVQPLSPWRTSSLVITAFLATVVFAIGLSYPSSTAQASNELPILGDTASAVVSPEKEFTVGRAWLRDLRSKAPIINDPLLNNYLETLIYRLAAQSELDKPNLEIVLINSSSINAFAVPGGVIGVNAGLFLNAETEGELGAVLAHELAHLSQRHFARSVERAKRTQWATMAAMLASVAIIATTGGGDPGLAALATTQALAIQSQLHFSRSNEREADRIGMQTLVRADIDPLAMPRFFERLNKATQYLGDQPPEFLLTHPVTASRIADSEARASRLPPTRYSESLEYQLMRARTLSAFSMNPHASIKRFKAQMNNSDSSENKSIYNKAARYGLVRSYLKANKYEEAHAALSPLRNNDPTLITFIVTEAEIYLAEEKYEKAIKLLKYNLGINPENYPLTIYYARALIKNGRPEQAIPALEMQALKSEHNPFIWQLLIEAYGGVRNIVNVHRARAEVQYLHNHNKQAIEQLEFALALTKNNFQLSEKIQNRIDYINAHASDLRF